MKTEEELAYCGCEECNIYRSVVYGEDLKPETRKRWREDAKKYWGVDSLDPKQLNCRGCRNKGEDVFYGFRLWPVTVCCEKRGLNSCGLCPEFQTCGFLEPEGRENPEKIAAAENKAPSTGSRLST